MKATDEQAARIVKAVLASDALAHTRREVMDKNSTFLAMGAPVDALSPVKAEPMQKRIEAEPFLISKALDFDKTDECVAAIVAQIGMHPHFLKKDEAQRNKCIVGIVPDFMVKGDTTRVLLAIDYDPTL